MDFINESHQVRTHRLGGDHPVTSDNLNAEIDRVFRDRYTCRYYDDTRQISDRDWQTIIHAGWRSPSSMGFEPWEFVLITDPKIREGLFSMVWGAQNRCEEASHFLLINVRTADQMRPESDYMTEILTNQGYSDKDMDARRARVDKFIGADTGTGWDPSLVEAWCHRQAYIPLANMMTVAALLGIDSTPIEGFDYSRVNQYLIDNNVVDPKHFTVGCFAAFGYSRQDGKTKTRRDIADVYREV